MRRSTPIAWGLLALAGAWGATSSVTAQTPAPKMVIFEFFERIT